MTFTTLLCHVTPRKQVRWHSYKFFMLNVNRCPPPLWLSLRSNWPSLAFHGLKRKVELVSLSMSIQFVDWNTWQLESSNRRYVPSMLWRHAVSDLCPTAQRIWTQWQLWRQVWNEVPVPLRELCLGLSRKSQILSHALMRTLCHWVTLCPKDFLVW